MKLHRLKINGFKRLEDIEIYLEDATFLIGQNNSGKSSILKAIGVLLSATKTLPSSDYYSVVDEETGETKPQTTKVVLEGEFRNLPEESKTWRGFKGRIFEYDSDTETGLSVTYRKTYELGKDVVIEFKSKIRNIKADFKDCKKPQDYINKGIQEEIISDYFPELDKNIGKSKAALEKLEQLDEIWDIIEEDTWFQNPGGIPGNVLKMLPRFLLIPVDTSINEIQGGTSGVLGKTLNELFQIVRENSDNFKNAQEYLEKLSKELDPEDVTSEFGKMMTELNLVLTRIFPESQLHATTDLSDPNKALKPSFNIEMSSNIKTSVENQGTGMVRAAVFGMLRFRQKWLSDKEDEHNRSLIISFEEPEIYLHPSAANQMRDTIYELSSSNSQIVASTHSPYLIDISRKPKQVLNRLIRNKKSVRCSTFSVSDAFLELQEDDKSYVKMILKIDDYISRAFYTNNIIIIEGDTEDILIRESLVRLPKEKYLRIISNFEVLKARGKAAIIGLVKYLTSMGIKPIVVHDRDNGIEGAVKFNQPIKDAVGTNGRIVEMYENVEDEIGYEATYEKPFKAFEQTQKWGESWEDIPENWRNKMTEIFGTYITE
ncbi:AAA family ATPase [Winogradskyella sp.]|uniref:AAA family ATPase n=1 Tax=Winogradskyella sp. TaxID=1883156 RepID=UPI00261F67FD|nr:AAA family ATPase [Winogradskyella sp.]